ncbi:MAG: penicillin-binding protein 1B [Gammaproteobacteria bacterium]|nr:penicillin-binding protein 1B [Gammaproteobacteria bacterium]|tara:strand:- start:596 stop:2911 length:2316 start_codon:yes stop_codon:yes gene_type:complete
MTKPEVKRDHSRQSWRRRLTWVLGLGVAMMLVWLVWIDYQVRRDFHALQWALPARIYARPAELYTGAQLAISDLTDYLQQLGYRQVDNVSGPGEYQVQAQQLRLQTRGFQFWDGREPSVHAQLDFEEQQIRQVSAAGPAPAGELPLVRLEPVEIAQINPDTGEDRLPVSLGSVPASLVHAIIAVEDQRFYQHWGVDPKGILRALWVNMRQGEVAQGGSTLTQQLVKNLYLTQDRTLRRKIEEAAMALALELHFSKDDILAAYLNEVFLGQDGNRAIHGFTLAAQYYFARPLAELSLAELALLAGLPRGASYYNPRRNPERAVNRRNTVLMSMHAQGYITAAEYETARTAELHISPRPTRRNRAYPAFMDLVRADLARDYDADALRSEGLRIFTTLDLRVQQTMDATLAPAVAAVEVPADDGAPLQAAMVITDSNTGEVRALAGSRRPGAVGFNRALDAVRPIGSLVKPAVYLAALESGNHTLVSVLSDRPVELTTEDGQRWSPRNYDNLTYGDVYLHDALARSLNLATVNLGMETGVDNVVDMLNRLGHSRQVPAYLSLLLGAVDMAPLEVARFYQTLASNGFRTPLRSVEAVTTGEGDRLQRYGVETEQVVDATSVFLLEQSLQRVFSDGTARSVAGALADNLPLAGKTGTTNDFRDSWFAGYGDDLTGVVWLGYDDNRSTGLSGATGALQVWAVVMQALAIQPRQTRAPGDIVWEEVPVQATLHPTSEACQATRLLPFREGQLPAAVTECLQNESLLNRVFDRFRSPNP